MSGVRRKSAKKPYSRKRKKSEIPQKKSTSDVAGENHWTQLVDGIELLCDEGIVNLDAPRPRRIPELQSRIDLLIQQQSETPEYSAYNTTGFVPSHKLTSRIIASQELPLVQISNSENTSETDLIFTKHLHGRRRAGQDAVQAWIGRVLKRGFLALHQQAVISGVNSDRVVIDSQKQFVTGTRWLVSRRIGFPGEELDRSSIEVLSDLSTEIYDWVLDYSEPASVWMLGIHPGNRCVMLQVPVGEREQVLV